MDVLSLPYTKVMHDANPDAVLPDIAERDKNFGLTAQAYQDLLNHLQAGDERLFEQVFVTQYKRCTRHLIFKYAAEEQAAKDAVMQALLEFRKLLLANKVNFGNLEAYFTRMAMTTYQQARQRNREDSVDTFSTEVAEEAETGFTEADFAAFASSWERMCDKCRTLLKRYYYDELPHAQIALLCGKNVAAVKQDKHRCVEKLRKLFFAQPEKSDT